MPLSAFATIPRPEHYKDAKDAILGILGVTRAEPGCLSFELHEVASEATLHLYEVWTDRTAFEAHHAEPYTREIFRRYEGWLARPIDITFMTPVA